MIIGLENYAHEAGSCYRQPYGHHKKPHPCGDPRCDEATCARDGHGLPLHQRVGFLACPRCGAEVTSTACRREAWCVLQVGHEGSCSSTFAPTVTPWPKCACPPCSCGTGHPECRCPSPYYPRSACKG